MTQPYQSQQYAPQQQTYYPQPQGPAQPYPQPAYAPQGQPYPPQQYGQPAAPPQGGQTLPMTPPALGQTRGAGGGVSPKARHLVGRTIIIEPLRVDEDAKAPDGKPRPEAYFHLTVVDGGPLMYGDSLDNDPAKQRPMSFRVETPCRFTNVSDYGWGFVQEVRDSIAKGDQASVGVFERGTQGNRPYLLTRPGTALDGSERPDGDQRFAAAMAVWTKIFNKDMSWNNAPVSLAAPPAQAPQQVSYQPAAPAPQQVPPNGYAQQGHYQQQPYTPGQQYAQPQQGQTFAQAAAPEIAAMGNPVQQAYAAAQPQGPYGEAAAYNPYTPVPQQPAQPAQDPQYLAWLASQQQAQSAPQGGPGI